MHSLPVSVVIPAFNREVLVERALQSVRSQTRPPAEIIVVDDCSEDRTSEVARALGARVLRHEVNQGAAAARNTGIGAATQPWVALLDSDDEWLPGHLATAWEMADGRVFVSTSAISLAEGGTDPRFIGPPSRSPMALDTPAQIMFPANFIAPSCALIRRDAIEAVGGLRTDFRFSEDFDLFLRLLDHGPAMASPQVTTVYHRHADQKGERPEAREVKRRIEQAHADRAWWSPALVRRRLARERWDDMRAALSQGRRGDAARHALHLATHPGDAVAVGRVLVWRARVRRHVEAWKREQATTKTLVVAPIPPRREPYLQLLYDALAEHDVGTVDLPGLWPSLFAFGRRPADVVHIHWLEFLLRAQGGAARRRLADATRLVRALAALSVLRRSRVRLVWTVHNLQAHDPRYPRAERLLARRAARAADALIVHSEHAGQRVRERYGVAGDKIHVIPHGNFAGRYLPSGRSRDEIRASLGVPADTFVFLAFGQVRRYKRVAELVAAFRTLEDPGARLVVAGSPRDEGVREEVEAAAAGDPRVLLRLDFIADDEVADLHEAADVAVLGYREVFSSGALLLALSLGLPLIAPAEGSTAEIGGPPAIRPFAPGELAAALAAAQAEITAADRDAARAVADRYDWASIAERTLAAYGLTELTPGR